MQAIVAARRNRQVADVPEAMTRQRRRRALRAPSGAPSLGIAPATAAQREALINHKALRAQRDLRRDRAGKRINPAAAEAVAQMKRRLFRA